MKGRIKVAALLTSDGVMIVDSRRNGLNIVTFPNRKSATVYLIHTLDIVALDRLKGEIESAIMELKTKDRFASPD